MSMPTPELGDELAVTNAVVAEIAAERLRQIHEEGHRPERDDAVNQDGELARAAAVLAALASLRPDERRDYEVGVWRPRFVVDVVSALWPWPSRPKIRARRRDLVRAAALIVAEIARLDRGDKRLGLDKLQQAIAAREARHG